MSVCMYAVCTAVCTVQGMHEFNIISTPPNPIKYNVTVHCTPVVNVPDPAR